MNYKMTKPCEACPFKRNSGFAFTRLKQFAAGEFPCHMASDLKAEGDSGIEVFVEKAEDKTPHCAGALIFNEKRGEPNQMQRIAGRLRLYDPRKLDMKADVGSKASDFRAAGRLKAQR